ncbi:hypothetical protein C8D92_11146 [Tamilnaduibacter salinus]|uniref:Uncharacterized protein n=1 Tax=Tamilnaduibacter salinus TaxID=1484056 RepID=A0A2U1CTC6_9GAMM|nr:hypothetical protein C8D92_11146 [Tamilnaduibacter salinus]
MSLLKEPLKGAFRLSCFKIVGANKKDVNGLPATRETNSLARENSVQLFSQRFKRHFRR